MPSTKLPPRRSAPALVILLLIGVAFALSACVSGGGASPSLIRISHPDTLNGTTWTAVLVSGVVPIAGREPTAIFDATSVSGTTGCNSYGGSYQYAAGALAFGPLMSTKIGCEPPISAMEQRFAAALEGATTASIDETGRLVVDGPAGSITFEVAPVLQPA